jgi:hypothetical protein
MQEGAMTAFVLSDRYSLLVTEFETDSVRAGEIRIGDSAGRVSRIVLPVIEGGTGT